MRNGLSTILVIILVAACISACAGPDVDYLSDVRHRIVFGGQAWGVLGIDTCAHAADQTPLPMQIGDKTYRKGLGHHASGEIIIDLEGLYDRFEAEVGVQKQASNTGSVVFQVYVDDDKRFDSGVMHESDAAKPVNVSVSGAAELRLVALDAGDGITCDCANWAEARLTRSANPTSVAPREFVDVAPFARVVTFDPKRMDGSRANRVQEFHADDLFLDTDLQPNKDGTYSVSPQDGLACIGLQWLERRMLREVGIEFADGSGVPSTDSVQVQAWSGESPWQGGWRPIKGEITCDGNRLTLKIDRIESPEIGAGTWKVRWIFPAVGPATVKRLTALTRFTWHTTEVRLELEEPMPGETGRITMYNGEIESADGVRHSVDWDLSKPIKLRVRYLKPVTWATDRTVIRLEVPLFACGIAVDDLLANKAIYVKDYPLLATIGSDGPSLAEYKRQIEGKQTILRQVRAMPDQTFEQAMDKTHNPIQENGPTMLSLACDNHKFVVEPDGSVRFPVPGAQSNPAGGDLSELTCLIRPSFGAKDLGRPERSFPYTAYPETLVSYRDGDIHYSTTSIVAPYDESAQSDEWPFINREPILEAKFTARNLGSEHRDASIAIAFYSGPGTSGGPQLTKIGDRVLVHTVDKLLAIVDTVNYEPTTVRVRDGSVFVDCKLRPDPKTPCDSSFVQIRVFVPTWSLTPDQHTDINIRQAFDAKMIDHWKKVLSPIVVESIPDRQLAKAVHASPTHCLIAARNEENGKRIAPWIGSDRYGPLESESNSIIRGMMLMGYRDFARKSLEFFIKRYSPEGFLTTGYTLMGMGWHLQTLGEYFDLTQDKEWMKSVAPDVERACKWIVAQRAKTKVLGPDGKRRPEYGLMPPGVGADWNAFAYHFALNGYYCAGLKEAAEALVAIGVPSAKDLLAEAEAFRKDINIAFAHAQGLAPVVPLQDGTWVPAYPGQLHCPGPTGKFFPGEDGNRSWCYDVELGAHHLVPQGVIPTASLAVDWMADHMEDVQFLSDGWFDYPAEKSKADWFNLGGFSKVQPYYTRNAEIYAMRDDVKPFIRSYFNTLATLLNTENLTLWEHFRNTGAWNKTHETGYFLQQTRWMYVQERGDQLWLAPFVTDRWLEDGKRVDIRSAPTKFGTVSYNIQSHVGQGYIDATIDPPVRSAPKEIALRLRHPEGKTPKSFTVTGIPTARFDSDKSAVIIPGPFKGKLDVHIEY